eukprot:14136828-Heterocapsa_arctica.AAC.1
MVNPSPMVARGILPRAKSPRPSAYLLAARLFSIPPPLKPLMPLLSGKVLVLPVFLPAIALLP